MKRIVVALTVAVWLMGAVPQALAHDAYNDSDSNPLKIASYPVAAVGFLVEWMVTRPIHFLVSNPQLERVFNHGPSEGTFGDYPAYLADDDY